MNTHKEVFLEEKKKKQSALLIFLTSPFYSLVGGWYLHFGKCGKSQAPDDEKINLENIFPQIDYPLGETCDIIFSMAVLETFIFWKKVKFEKNFVLNN